MMSDSDALYKSRLFNFLNRQMLRGRDRAAQTLRYLQVALLWSVQILAYPVYLLVQTGRAIGRKLEGNPSQIHSTSSPLSESEPFSEIANDVPIVRVLEVGLQYIERETEMETLGQRERSNSSEVARQPAEQSISPQPAPAIAIRAIASSLATRKLVLVGTNNRVFDVLTPEQNRQLQHRIVWEIANLNRDRKALQEAFLALRVPSDAAKDERVLPPARWFWRTMGWIQQGTVARAIDLFGESTWVAPSRWGENLDLNLPLHLPAAPALPLLFAWVEPLDRAIARTETQLAAVTLEKIPEKFPFFEQFESNLPLQNFPPITLFNCQIQTLSDFERATFQSLIRAAIDYFFGYSEPNISSSSADGAETSNRSDACSLATTDALEAELWLSWEDLYHPGANNVFGDFSPRDRSPVAFFPSVNSSPSSQRASILKQRSRPFPPVSPSQPLLHPHRNTPNTDSPSPPAALATTPLDSISEEDPITDWLEIESVPVGYVKHPLEQILEWLDRVMLGLEEFLLSVWRWIYRKIP
ncbi:MAG: hypothetical protein SVX43_00265 [Cyanobacteriota bacterium]|nr:hypothetical protein [Cyanobacteriota bacterium]